MNQFVFEYDGAEYRRVNASACSQRIDTSVGLLCDGRQHTLKVGYTVKLAGDFDQSWVYLDRFAPANERPDPNRVWALSSTVGTASCGSGDGVPPGPSTLDIDAPKAWSGDGTETTATVTVGGIRNTPTTRRSFSGFAPAPTIANYPAQEWNIATSGRTIQMRFFYPSDAPGTGRAKHRVNVSADVNVNWTEYEATSFSSPQRCVRELTPVWKRVLNRIEPNRAVYQYYWVVRNPERDTAARSKFGIRPYRVDRDYSYFTIAVRSDFYGTDDNGIAINYPWPRQFEIYDYPRTEFETIRDCSIAVSMTSRRDIPKSRVDRVLVNNERGQPQGWFDLEVFKPRLTN